jgi:hypothetical protein
MSSEIFYQELQADSELHPLDDLIAANLYLVSDYNIDISEISSVAKLNEQQYIEKLFLATISLMSLLDKAFVYKMHTIEHTEISVIEDDFFQCLKRLPHLAIESIPSIKNNLSTESLMALKENIISINEKIAQGLESWFEEKQNNLQELLENTMHHEQKKTIAKNMIHSLYTWRESYLSAKNEKIQQALENISKMDTENSIDVAELGEEEKSLLLKSHTSYSPLYTLCHINLIPIELCFQITLILEKAQPALSDEELLRIEEAHNVFALEYLKILNHAERDRNIILHSLNTLSEYFQSFESTS